mmetsp:Transcript_24347/g.45351  ORF Transcript_24347/g.45351 Transcript_24347/m.45351 type:complete len:285 (+) Transcript_24347:716-1570(+)
MWQDFWDHDELSQEEFFVPVHYEGDLLDEPLPFELPGVEWDFRMVRSDGTKEFPTPREVMNMDGPILSVRYQSDYMASIMPDYEPNPRLFEVAEATMNPDFVRCDRDSYNASNQHQSQRRERSRETESSKDDNNHQKHGPYFRGRNDRRTMKQNPGNIHQDAGIKRELLEKRTQEQEKLPSGCRQINYFTRDEDRQKWDKLCREMPRDATVAERLAVLAQQDCRERSERHGSQNVTGTMEFDIKNPLFWGDSANAVMTKWIINMNKRKELVAFECFHLPERKRQ